MRPLPALLAILALSLSVSPARAQGGRAPALTIESAETLAGRAREAARAGDFTQAAVLWGAAYDLEPLPEYQLQIGDAYRKVPGSVAANRALRAYRRYLVEETQPPPQERERVLQAIRDLVARIEREPAPRPSMGADAVRGVAPAPDYRHAEPAAPQRLSLVPVARVPSPALSAEASATARRTRMRRSGIGLLVAGAVLGGVGGALLGTSVSAAQGARGAADFSAHLDERDGALRLLGGGTACLGVAGVSLLFGGGLLVLAPAAPRGPAPPARPLTALWMEGR